MGEGALVGRWVVDVAGSDIGTAYDDFAFGARHEQRSVGRHHRHFRTRSNTHGAGLAGARRQRVAGHLVGRLGHSVRLDDRTAEGRLEFSHDLRGQRGG